MEQRPPFSPFEIPTGTVPVAVDSVIEHFLMDHRHGIDRGLFRHRLFFLNRGARKIEVTRSRFLARLGGRRLRRHAQIVVL